jgi:hypothetical protein
MKKNLHERSEKLMIAGKEIQQCDETGKPWPRRKINKWKTDVYTLERDFDFYNFYLDNQRSPIWYYFRLGLGILRCVGGLVVHAVC